MVLLPKSFKHSLSGLYLFNETSFTPENLTGILKSTPSPISVQSIPHVGPTCEYILEQI